MLEAIFNARYNEEALNELFAELWEFPNDKYTNEETLKYNALITYFFGEINLKKHAEKIEVRWGFKL